MKRPKKLPFIKLYDGYGHSENIVVYGHLFQKQPHVTLNYEKNGLLNNIWQLIKLFKVKPVPHTKVKLIFESQSVEAMTSFDGFFKIEMTPDNHLTAGWHAYQVCAMDDKGMEVSSATGKVFVPHLSQFAFISDIDDTIIRSFSAKIFKRLYELISRNSAKRRLFDETAKQYSLLAFSFIKDELPNPFFYVSSSEWNLYDYLKNVFQAQKLPEGIFLLNQIKRWKQLLLTGKTNHDGKFLRIVRIFKAFPNQQFILLGDNSQKDPEIYARVADKYAAQIFAIYIRNVRASKAEDAQVLLDIHMKNGIPVCIFKDSKEAIEHGIKIGLIDANLPANFA
jgi:phosphatidate phosphatase APP1